jgi:hypothetical protein
VSQVRTWVRIMLLFGFAFLATFPGRSAILAGAENAPVAGTGDPDAPAQVRFAFENPQLQPAKYVLAVEENGSGHYSSERGAAVLDNTQFPVPNQDRAIQISPATRDTIFAAARNSKYFAIPCESGGNRVAFQGKKTLEYSGAGGHGSCTFNWSKDKQIELLADIFEGIAATLDEGARLEVEYEHSRLTLDAELETLTELVHDGRAIELNNIAPILTKIAEDDAVLKQAQRRARDLLSGANPAR